jgi:hypothetical protein
MTYQNPTDRSRWTPALETAGFLAAIMVIVAVLMQIAA